MNLTEKQKENILASLIVDSGTRELLKSLIEKELTPDPYIEACAKLGIVSKPELPTDSDSDDIWADAIKRLSICIRAFNMEDGKEWKQVYDGTEYHYTPIATPDPSGSGWAFISYGSWILGTRLPGHASNIVPLMAQRMDLKSLTSIIK